MLWLERYFPHPLPYDFTAVDYGLTTHMPEAVTVLRLPLVVSFYWSTVRFIAVKVRWETLHQPAANRAKCCKNAPPKTQLKNNAL